MLPTPSAEQALLVREKVTEIIKTILPGQHASFALFIIADDGHLVFSDAPNSEALITKVGQILNVGPSKILDYRTKAES